MKLQPRMFTDHESHSQRKSQKSGNLSSRNHEISQVKNHEISQIRNHEISQIRNHETGNISR